jgi:glycerate dehydrogenase
VALGMSVLVSTRTKPQSPSVLVELASLDELFRRSDVVSLHCPLTSETESLVDESVLFRMKADAYLINTARGPLVDESALARALTKGRLAGAGLDVLSREPPPEDHPLVTAPRCIITPHVGWGTTAARQRLMHEAVENVRAFLRGEPRNVVT